MIGVAGFGSGMAINSRGNVVTGSAAVVFELDPRTGVTTQIAIVPSLMNGFMLEAATEFLAVGALEVSNSSVYVVDDTGTSTLLASISGGVSGVAVLDNPRTYGDPTPGTSTFTWNARGNPDGLPRAGNSMFGVQVDSTGGDATGALLLGVNASLVPILGFDLLVAPLVSVPVPTSGAIPLPLPAGAATSITGAIRLQTLHIDSGAPQGIAASDGLYFSIMR